MNAQQMWINRLVSGTWTPELLVPEMQAAQKSAVASTKSFYSTGTVIEDSYTRDRRP